MTAAEELEELRRGNREAEYAVARERLRHAHPLGVVQAVGACRSCDSDTVTTKERANLRYI